MFTGFIKQTGIIEQINFLDSRTKLIIKVSSQFASEISIKSNIAIDGRVLTVSKKEDFNDLSYLEFYASNRQKISSYYPQKTVNLERAIRFGEEIPGAFFYGIPTGKVKIISLEKLPDAHLIMEISWQNNLIKYLSVKDQVCLDGVLLQIKTIDSQIISFELYPTTLTLTNLGSKQVGDTLNIEIEPLTLKVAKIFQKLQSN